MKIIIRLTAENLDDLRAGDVIEGAEELGRVWSIRLTRDGEMNAMIRGGRMSDIFGLPQTLTVIRN